MILAAYDNVKVISHVLEQKRFQVENGVGNVATSFMARPADCKPSRPSVALLAEYDALPKIGHNCGHNLIAAAGKSRKDLTPIFLGTK